MARQEGQRAEGQGGIGIYVVWCVYLGDTGGNVAGLEGRWFDYLLWISFNITANLPFFFSSSFLRGCWDGAPQILRSQQHRAGDQQIWSPWLRNGCRDTVPRCCHGSSGGENRM